MTASPTTAVAIIPCTDLAAAEAWWARLGFARRDDAVWHGYRILFDDAGGSIHLTEAPDGWLVPDRNPFGVYVYTDRVDELAAALHDDVLEPGGLPQHKPWGMYEFALDGPDGVLVRIGRPIS